MIENRILDKGAVIFPSLSLQAKLGSLTVHVEEFFSLGHPYDVAAIKSILDDEEVKQWLARIRQLGIMEK